MHGRTATTLYKQGGSNISPPPSQLCCAVTNKHRCCQYGQQHWSQPCFVLMAAAAAPRLALKGAERAGRMRAKSDACVDTHAHTPDKK